MGRFVDDFKLAGHKPALPHARAEIFECFDVAGPPQPVSRFVGSEEILLFDSYETASMGPSPLTVALWGSCCGRVRCVRPATLLGP
eukprot:s3589_g3.t1